MIRDLLNPSSGILDLREDSSGAVVVAGLLEVETTSTREVMSLLSQGNQRRTCEPTAVNKTSSRSHAILKVCGQDRLPDCALVLDVQLFRKLQLATTIIWRSKTGVALFPGLARSSLPVQNSV